MWDLVPQPKNKPGSPALEVRSISHWTTREVPQSLFLNHLPHFDPNEKNIYSQTTKISTCRDFFFSFAVLRSIHEEHLSPRGPDYGMGQDTWEANSLEQQLQ